MIPVATINTPITTGPTNVNVCPIVTTYMRIGQANDPLEVAKLQAFLKVFEHFDYVTVNGTFDQATHQAVMEFQTRYASEILAPWGTNTPTGYVYITTQRMINKIACGINTPLPSLPHPSPIIGKATKEGGKEMGGYSKEGGGSTTTAYIPLVGVNVLPKGQTTTDNGQTTVASSRLGLGAALTSWPATPFDTVQCLYEFLLILIVLYIAGSVLQNVLYKDTVENVRKRFVTKWITVSVGLLLAMLGAYLLKEYCLMLPLLVTLVLSLLWLATSKKHSAIKTQAKTWYTETQEKAKSIPSNPANGLNNHTVMVRETKTS
jgi:hypothetical protein